MAKVEALSSADSVDPLRYIAAVAESEDPEVAVSALVNVANAGAALTLAIYHGGKDFVLSMPDPVVRAYMTACRVYGVGRH
jgi:hypothetical protein